MKMTVAELINDLKAENPNAIVIFGSGDLTLYRIEDRRGEVQFEFNELYTITS